MHLHKENCQQQLKNVHKDTPNVRTCATQDVKIADVNESLVARASQTLYLAVRV